MTANHLHPIDYLALRTVFYVFETQGDLPKLEVLSRPVYSFPSSMAGYATLNLASL